MNDSAALRVLVVDDERPALDEMAFLLGKDARVAGVLTSDSAAEALRLLQSEHVDAVFMDVAMPGLDGLGVLQSLRAAGSQIPVIFLTARDAAQDRIVGLRAGADDYVVKPFSVEELLARVSSVRQTGQIRRVRSNFINGIKSFPVAVTRR